MRLIDQYRQGRMAPSQYIPGWVHSEVAAVTEEIPADWAIVELRELSAARLPYESRLRESRELLGIEGAGTPAGLVSIVQARVDADPEREADYWDAMWTVRKIAETEERFQHVLKHAAEWLETSQRFKEAGWPQEWDFPYCEIWEVAGGTPLTATAWARAGWSAREVLIGHITKNGRTVPFSSRVRETHPARFGSAFDWYDSSASRWEFLTATRQENR